MIIKIKGHIDTEDTQDNTTIVMDRFIKWAEYNGWVAYVMMGDETE